MLLKGVVFLLTFAILVIEIEAHRGWRGWRKCHPKCDKGCRKVRSGRFCHECDCEPVCPYLKCEEGCEKEKVPEEPCPVCVCKEEEEPALDYGETYAKCYPKCGKYCRKVFNAKGCYECKCEPFCPYLKCEEGCAIEKVPGEPCPLCVCRKEEVPAIDYGEALARCYPKCGKGCRKHFTVKGCYKCDCKPICPYLKCKEGCSLEKSPEEPCPVCVCKEEDIPVLDIGESLAKCYPKCGTFCHKVFTAKGCYKCHCKPVCPFLKCKVGCSLERHEGEPCPSCVCKEEEVPALDVGEGREKCYPKCEKGCKKVFTAKGCYECKCEPVCPELKCKEGCTEETQPGQRCPSCVCKEEEAPTFDFGESVVNCHPKCEKGCRKVFTKNKCYRCDCKPVCSELTCDEGCSPEKLPDQPCPSCVCQEEEVPVLDVGEGRDKCYPKCEKGCQKVFTGKGCYECKCEPACPELKCNEGCAPEQLPGESCPSCVCTEEIPALDRRIRRENCYPKCEKDCDEVFTEDGCIQCDCRPTAVSVIEEDLQEQIVCEPPTCQPGCNVQTTFEGPCPACECDDEVLQK